MNNAMVAAIVRHILTVVGGGLMTQWGMDGQEIEAVVGAIAVLVGIGWSMYDKNKIKQLPK